MTWLSEDARRWLLRASIGWFVGEFRVTAGQTDPDMRCQCLTASRGLTLQHDQTQTTLAQAHIVHIQPVGQRAFNWVKYMG